MELYFDNFILRPFRSSDYKPYFYLIENNRNRLEKYFPVTVRSTLTVESTKQHIAERIYLAEKLEFFTYAISIKGSDKIIGLIFLKNIDWNIPKSEIGFFIDKEFEGKGIVSKGLKLVIEHSFEKLKINKLFIRVGEDNPGSRRIAEKSGFLLEGKLRNDFKTHDGLLLDVYYYGLIQNDKPHKEG